MPINTKKDNGEMGRFILKIKDEIFNKDYYLEWSTVTDSPVSFGMELEEFKKYYISEYGEASRHGLEERLERTNRNGSSGYSPYDILEEFFESNRAGDKGESIGKEEILELYCRTGIAKHEASDKKIDCENPPF